MNGEVVCDRKIYQLKSELTKKRCQFVRRQMNVLPFIQADNTWNEAECRLAAWEGRKVGLCIVQFGDSTDDKTIVGLYIESPNTLLFENWNIHK